MGFDVTAEAYARFMGVYSQPLSARFAEFVGLSAGQRALDVGCGPGILTQRLVDALGAQSVAAVDPSSSFEQAARARFPQVDVRAGYAEALPFPDDDFDLAIAELVVPFMKDPVAGLREMARVVRPTGIVAACAWDHAGGRSPLAAFWRAAEDLSPGALQEADLPGSRENDLVELCEAAGLVDIVAGSLTVSVTHATFDDWWEPLTFGIGPAGEHVAGLDETARARLRSRAAELLPPAPFEIHGRAWCVRAGPPRGDQTST